VWQLGAKSVAAGAAAAPRWRSVSGPEQIPHVAIGARA
jgi:hypothetical protein